MNSPALCLLMVSTSRTLLNLNCGTLRNLEAAAKAQSSTSPLGLTYQELEAVFQESPVTVKQFQELLKQLDGSIKNTYQNTGINHDDTGQHKREKEERSSIEKDMLIKGTIPSIHLDVVEELLTSTVPKLKEQVNVAELFFKDIGWLGLTDDRSGRRWREKHPMDVLRKTELKKGAKTKRCTRCGGLAEDTPAPRGVNMIVMNLQRHCICGSWFMVGEEENGAQVGNVGF